MQMGRHKVGNEKIYKEVALPAFIANRQWMAVFLAVFMAVALSACGGSSSKTATMPDPDPTPMPNPADTQRTAINSAIAAAQTAVPGVNDDSTGSEVSAADTAIANARAAITAATAVPAEEKAAHTATVNALAAQLDAAKTSRTAAMAAADKAGQDAMAKTGKALYAALAGTGADNSTALNNIDTDALALSSAGLVIDAVGNAGKLTTDPDSVTLKAGDSAGSLGGWTGKHYAHMDSTTKIENAAVVYTNQGAAKRIAFDKAGHTIITEDGATKGMVLVEPGNLSNVMASAFTHSGTQTHPVPAGRDALYVRGTYDGAPGEYRCTESCSSTNDGKGSPSALGGTWHFKPDSGAMVSRPDMDYLYFGWWVSKDKDGGPTAASAFAGRVGSNENLPTATSGESLTGSASYAGKAAGKFAMHNVLDGTGNGGHFTADAMLEAKFGSGSDAGMTGTIDNFRLNDGSEDPGWSVSLARGGWGSDGAISAPASKPTVWSINGNKADASGTWSGQMYDEKPGDPPDGDGSNLPTTVTGTFYSEFSTIGRMVGGFGVNKQ